MTSNENFLPKLTFPKAEAEAVRSHYKSADVILEYGSGGSTVMAAQMHNKFVISVESDKSWAVSLQYSLDEHVDKKSSCILYHVDIGPTGAWGRPVNGSHWQRFHRYPLAIWNEPFFRNPDVILIDGRFRAACFVASCMLTKGPTTILFDDYLDRPSYKIVEELLEPSELIGRMAVFHIKPQCWPDRAYHLLARCCAEATYSSSSHEERMHMYGSVSQN